MKKRDKILLGICLACIIVFVGGMVVTSLQHSRQIEEWDKEWEAFWAEKTDRLAEEVEERKDELKEELSNKVEGDIIEFGDFCGNKEWIILKKEGDRITLLSKNCITHRKMTKSNDVRKWEDSDLRSWLNEEYIQTAFGVIDRQLIETTRIENHRNEAFVGSEDGNDTDDKVFLLSQDEMEQYFPDEASRIAMMEDGITRDEWWLRASGWTAKSGYFYPVVATYGGWESLTGGCVRGVRPVLVLNLSNFDSTDVASLMDSIKNGYHPWQSSKDFSQEDWDRILMKMKIDGIKERKREEIEILEAEAREGSVIDRIRNAEEGEKITDHRIKAYEKSVDEWDCISNLDYWEGYVDEYIFYTDRYNDYNGLIEADDWTILKKENGRALLVLSDGFPLLRYHDQYQNITWENCSLRRWLNDYYLKNAISDELISRIEETSVENHANVDYGTDGGNDTIDKVFLLSIEEANQYYLSGKLNLVERHCWLRSPGRDNTYVACMEPDGSINTAGYQFIPWDLYYAALPWVRPAIWVRLD